MEFITDVTAVINEAGFKHPERLLRVLQSYDSEKSGPCYKVRGTYEEVENLSITLSDAQHRSSPASHGRPCQRDDHASTHVQSVDVSGVVIAYMEQKCAKELHKIQGSRFVIETQPGFYNKPGSTVRVTFRPRHVPVNPVHADFVRQRFITFYQRTASDLQVISVPVSARDLKGLQGRFPHLLFEPSHSTYGATVTGPFVHVAKLKEFLLQNAPSSSKSPANSGPSSRTLGLSPARSEDPEDESCPICMEPIVTSEKETLQCKHSFCRTCLKQAFDYKPVCPTCGNVYGHLTGTQPDGGTMEVSRNVSSLPGHEWQGTIVIHYCIPSGIQKEEHPNPGQPYKGVSRRVYLPDSSEGRKVLELLKRAFDQRLIFTVGQSATSGRTNTVTWNDIHHKTSTHGGPTCYGYPDPDYLSRVRDELKAKGIE